MDFLSILVDAAHLIFPVGANLRSPFWGSHRYAPALRPFLLFLLTPLDGQGAAAHHFLNAVQF